MELEPADGRAAGGGSASGTWDAGGGGRTASGTTFAPLSAAVKGRPRAGGRKPLRSGRVTKGKPRGHRNGRVTPPKRVWPEDEPALPPLDGIVAALESFEDIGDAGPLDVELQVSRFLAMLGAGAAPPEEPDEPDHEELLNGIVEVCLAHLEQHPPRVVLDFLWVLDAFDPGWVHWPLRRRLEAAAVPARPAWAMDVGQAEVVGTHHIRHETGDGFDVAIVARHRSAPRDHVVAVYVDRTLGGLASDLLVHDDAAQYLRLADDDAGMTREVLDPATAAATIDEAVDATFAARVPPTVADGFAPLWAIVEHYVAKLPPGGAPLPPPSPASPEECAAVVDRFLDGLTGMAHRRDREVLLAAVELVNDELGGDPLRWTAPVTQLVLRGWLPLSGFDEAVNERLPDLLRAFVPWAHAEEGWGQRYLDEALSVLEDPDEGDTPDDGPAGAEQGAGRVEILEQAVAAGVDLDDEAALDAFLDEYLEGDEDS